MAASDNLNPVQFYHGMNPAQFYHGTNAELRPGDIIEPGHSESTFNYDRPPRHAYITKSLSTAQKYARFRADERGGHPHVYRVDPVGAVRRDPEGVEGNYRTHQARVLGEI